MPGFLDRVRVLDLSRGIAGAAAAKLLTDWGADTIKVERPGEGDAARHWGPFAGNVPGPEKSLLFLYLNAGKRGVTLDLRAAGASAVFADLVRWADIVVESFEPATAERLGITYEALQRVKPETILVSISSFGPSGPYRDLESTELIEYALSGLLYHIGRPDREPIVHGAPQAEYVASVNAANGALGALLYKEATGVGQHVDVSIAECLTMMLSVNELSPYSYAGGVYGRGMARPAGVEIRECADGYVVPIQGQRVEWEKLAEFLEAPELLAEEFADPVRRAQNGAKVAEIVGRAVLKKKRWDLFHGAQALGMTWGIVQDMADLANCPQLASHNFYVEVEHPVVGKVKQPGVPFRMTASTSAPPRGAPLLGQHNREVYEDLLGYELQALARDGLI